MDCSHSEENNNQSLRYQDLLNRLRGQIATPVTALQDLENKIDKNLEKEMKVLKSKNLQEKKGSFLKIKRMI